MSTKKVELDVDVIGGEEPLTDKEEKALSEYFKQRKNTQDKRALKRTKTMKRSNVNVG